jgi:hypothetical protein
LLPLLFIWWITYEIDTERNSIIPIWIGNEMDTERNSKPVWIAYEIKTERNSDASILEN